MMPAKLSTIVKWKLGFPGINLKLDSLVPFRTLHFAMSFSITGSTSTSLIQGLLSDATQPALCKLLKLSLLTIKLRNTSF